MFYIVTQDGERLQSMQDIGLEYVEKHNWFRSRESIHHTLYIDDGTDDGFTMEAAEYKSREDCLHVIEMIMSLLEQDAANSVVRLPEADDVGRMYEIFQKNNLEINEGAR